jgi:alpha-beta hydrolase superfamily lysophospholipase
MRLFLILAMLWTPVAMHAGLLDLLPLKRIERKMLYPLSPIEVAPATVGLPNTQVMLHPIDKGHLVVWSVPAKGRTKARVLYFHGNAGNLANRAQCFRLLRDQGFEVVAMSYRGSSGSSGVPSEDTITKDALALFETLTDKHPNTTSIDLILYGESLGSAVAIAVLHALPANLRPAGVILEAPFTSTPAMARAMMDIPDNLIARIEDRWDSLSRAKVLTLPMLIIHGAQDEVTPQTMGRAIFNAAPSQDKNFISVQGASHSGTWRSDTMPKLWRFIRTYGG